MRAAQLVAYEKDFQVQQADAPVITDPHDVIVRVGGAGFCRADIHMWLGQLDATQKGARIDLPFTCGHETAGWVAEVGLGVTYVRVGDSVLLHPQSTCGHCRACRAGDDMHCTAATSPEMQAWTAAEPARIMRAAAADDPDAAIGGDCWRPPGCAVARHSRCAGVMSTWTPLARRRAAASAL